MASILDYHLGYMTWTWVQYHIRMEQKKNSLPVFPAQPKMITRKKIMEK